MKHIGIIGKLLTFLSLTLLLIFILIYSIYHISFSYYTDYVLKNSEKLLMDKYEYTLHSNTEIAVTLLATINNLEKLSKSEKLDLAGKLIRNLRFGKDGYYFVYQEGTGINLIHGSNRQLEGTNLWNLQNPDKKQYIIRELDRVAKQNKIFYEYFWTKPGTKKLFPKLGTAMLVPGTNMWVGTGAYIDEINKSKSKLIKAIKKISSSTRTKFFIGFIILTPIAFLIIIILGKNLTQPIKKLIISSKAISRGDYSIEIETNTKDEIGQLAATFNEMTKTLKDLTDNLEHKVDERTHNLEEAMEKLNESNFILEGLSDKLSRYLSPQIREMIFTGKQDVTISSRRKKLTVFFSDIKNFTQTTERMETEDLTKLLNNYLDEMSHIAIKHGATIDKFIGDAILVFIGDPETRGEKTDALAAATMAVEMRSRIKELQHDWDRAGISEPFQIRMGINTGYCTVGNFGSNDRMEYTIIGSQVNLASRLESAAEPDQILISHETHALIRDEFYCVKQKAITAKGISYSINTYQIVDTYDNLKKEDRLLEEHMDGFSFTVDLNKIDPDAGNKISVILNDAILKLQGGVNNTEAEKKSTGKRADLKNIIRKANEEVNKIADKKNITVDINIKTDSSELVTKEKSLLLIIKDFLLNAIHISQPGSTVTLIAVTEEQTVKIHITDEADSIPRDMIKEIFKPETESLKDYPGINLYNAKENMIKIDGQISVKSTPGQGNSFTLSLPSGLHG